MLRTAGKNTMSSLSLLTDPFFPEKGLKIKHFQIYPGLKARVEYILIRHFKKSKIHFVIIIS